jgi:prepilin-type processing-associated H-X9-DG protein
MLAFLALARLPSLEQLRYCAPGEWGKLLGLDRIPEVRTVRKKLALLSDQHQASAWSAELCAQWMGEDPDQAAVLYVDGHVRVYHGQQTPLPRHYVARQKLCLRATTDYWVNAAWMDSRSFCSTRPSIPGCSRCWSTRSYRVWNGRFPTSPPPSNWRPMRPCIGSPWSLTEKAIVRPFCSA